ncbi:hypothetical protein R84B8_01406 [Treponema sp. R8-4-B8]
MDAMVSSADSWAWSAAVMNKAINTANIIEITTEITEIIINSILEWLAVTSALLLVLFSTMFASSYNSILSAPTSSTKVSKFSAIFMHWL